MRVDPQEPARIAERERPKQDDIYDRERGDRGADAKRQGDNRDGEKARRLAQGANAEPHILEQRVDKISPERFATFFLETFTASKLDPGAAFRFSSLET